MNFSLALVGNYLEIVHDKNTGPRPPIGLISGRASAHTDANNLLKSHFRHALFCIFSEHLSLRTPMEGCFCFSASTESIDKVNCVDGIGTFQNKIATHCRASGRCGLEMWNIGLVRPSPIDYITLKVRLSICEFAVKMCGLSDVGWERLLRC